MNGFQLKPYTGLTGLGWSIGWKGEAFQWAYRILVFNKKVEKNGQAKNIEEVGAER